VSAWSARGCYINEDHFLGRGGRPADAENPCPSGETGELVITTLTKEAFPVHSFPHPRLDQPAGRAVPLRPQDPCALARVAGRSDDVLIISRTKVSPSQIATLLGEIEGQVPPHQVVVERPGSLDEVSVLIAPSESGAFDELRNSTSGWLPSRTGFPPSWACRSM